MLSSDKVTIPFAICSYLVKDVRQRRPGDLDGRADECLAPDDVILKHRQQNGQKQENHAEIFVR